MSGFDTHPAAIALGWTFIHFLWQGALVGAATAIVLRLMRRQSAEARHAAALAAMAMIAAFPLVTFALVLNDVLATIEIARAGADVTAATADSSDGAWWTMVDASTPTLAIVWIIGAALLHLRLIVRWGRVERLRRCGVSPAAAPLVRLVDELHEQLNVRRAVRVLESSLVRTPAVVGWLSPVVLVPLGVQMTLTPAQLRAIIAHELAHIRRHDYLINIAIALVESTLFFHPAVWWLSGRIRAEREFCCDDVAVSACGDALTYARALERLESLRDPGLRPALASTGGPLMQRISRLFHQQDARVRGRRCSIVPATAALATLLAATTVGAAATTAAPPREEIQREITEVAREIEQLQQELTELRQAVRESAAPDRPSTDAAPSDVRDERMVRRGPSGAPAHVDRASDLPVPAERLRALRQRIASGNLSSEEAQRVRRFLSAHPKIRERIMRSLRAPHAGPPKTDAPQRRAPDAAPRADMHRLPPHVDRDSRQHRPRDWRPGPGVGRPMIDRLPEWRRRMLLRRHLDGRRFGPPASAPRHGHMGRGQDSARDCCRRHDRGPGAHGPERVPAAHDKPHPEAHSGDDARRPDHAPRRRGGPDRPAEGGRPLP